MKKAYKIYKYWLIYREWLIENNLDDDTEFINIDSLIQFVEKQISKEDAERIWAFCQEAY